MTFRACYFDNESFGLNLSIICALSLFPFALLGHHIRSRYLSKQSNAAAISAKDIETIKSVIKAVSLNMDEDDANDDVRLPEDDEDEGDGYHVHEPSDDCTPRHISIAETETYPIIHITIGSNGSTIKASLADYPSTSQINAADYDTTSTKYPVGSLRDRSEAHTEDRSPTTLWQKIRSMEEDSYGFVEGDHA